VSTMAPNLTAIAPQRHLVTGISGPKSRALAGRRDVAVAPGVSSVLPVLHGAR
jgi:hypothetical protein